MRHIPLILICLFTGACAGNLHLQRVTHQTADTLIVLDKEEIMASPSFPPPYQHPQTLSSETILRTLKLIRVIPNSGFLNTLFSGKDKDRPLLDPDSAEALSIQLSEAFAKATPLERINFYRALPSSPAEVRVTSGSIIYQEDRLHLRVNHFQVPLRKGSALSSAGKGLAPSETSKYRFVLSQNKQMRHRQFKNVFGLEGTDDHWLVIDLADLPDPQAEASAPSPESPLTIEEKLSTLKRLKEQGLISEQDYIEKKQALLQAF